jgi:hypothetical protein
MTFGVIRWWVESGTADAATESALATELGQLGVDFVHWQPSTLRLRFPGTSDDAQLSFQSLRSWVTAWKVVARQQFGSGFRALIVATLPNAFGDL